MPHWVRSTLAVLAGIVVFYAVLAVCAGLTSKFLDIHADRPTPLYMTVALVYTLLGGLAAGYAAARLGGRNPVSHGVGVTMVLLAISVWNLVMKAGGNHNLFVLAVNIGAPLMAMLGAFVYRVQQERELV